MPKETWAIGRRSMQRSVKLAGALLLVLSSGCASGLHANSVPHCDAVTDRPDASIIDEQLVVLHYSQLFEEFLDYHDSLEAYCLAINEARGE
jgi:hypothetical protein